MNKILLQFIGRQQQHCLAYALRGEEGDYFRAMLAELAAHIGAMPKTYEQEGKGDEAVIHLHYFKGGADWWITEKDAETPDAPGQHQAFGLADLGDGPELGYISIVELISHNVELDLHWTPKTIGQLKAEKARPLARLAAPELLTEEAARELSACPGCKGPKDKGALVCWDCFKHGSNPLKYFNGSFAEWLLQRTHLPTK